MVLIKLRNGDCVAIDSNLFTFQYGSNQIALSLSIFICYKRFTFQYGSNQIRYILNLAIATYTDILFVYLQINIYFPK